MNKILFLLFGVIILSACVEMRDFTGRKNGGVVAFSRHEFGSGEGRHDYYKIDDNTALIIDDTKNEVRQKIGSPDIVEPTADGCTRWAYKDKGIELFFDGDYLRSWRELKS